MLNLIFILPNILSVQARMRERTFTYAIYTSWLMPASFRPIFNYAQMRAMLSRRGKFESYSRSKYTL